MSLPTDLTPELFDAYVVEARRQLSDGANPKAIHERLQKKLESEVQAYYSETTRVLKSAQTMPSAEVIEQVESAAPVDSTENATAYLKENVSAEPDYLAPNDTLGYLGRMFEPGDWLDIKLIHQTRTYKDQNGVERHETKDHFQFLEKALEPATPAQLVALQDDGWNIYIAMNVYTPNLTRRREQDIQRINSVYIEFDSNTDEGLAKVDDDVEAGLIPAADFVLRSSEGKAYVIWLVKDFHVQTQKAINKALQTRYGSDPQSVDAARVLRLPGTRNLKYSPAPVVTIENECLPHTRAIPAEFKIEYIVPKTVDRTAAPEKVQTRMSYYEEACDNAGVEAGDLRAETSGSVAGSYAYTVACPAWESHTNKSKYDGSVWISPSGHISYACWHTHEDLSSELGAKPGWANFYRPWLEEQAKENGFKGFLKFGDISEVEDGGEIVLQPLSSNAATLIETPADAAVEDAVETESDVPDGRRGITVADIHSQLEEVLVGREMPWQHRMAADFFTLLFGENYRYSVMDKSGSWMQWNGHMWHPGSIVTMRKRMDDLLKRIQTQIIPTLRATDGNLLMVLRGLEKKCASADFMSGVMRMLESMLKAEFKDFDSEKRSGLVNFINGTYELETGNFRKSAREDMLTQTMPVSYQPNATCPTWLKFLENSFPDVEVREFLQRFFGYTLEGTGKEKLAAFFHGYGDNGKTMLMAVLTALFGYMSDGAYGKSVSWETFAENKTGSIRNDIARLHNARVVFCDESEQGMVLKESVFKALTGSSPITSRFLHKEFFTFFARFVFILTTNRLPSVKGGDGASWSRILKIPMTESFPVGHPKRIEGLKALLMAEREGIMAWVVEGYRKYRQDGLKVPASIRKASAEYRENSDIIESFLMEACEPGEGLSVAFDSFYFRYAQRCKQINEKEQGRDSLIDSLKAHGYDVRRRMNLQGRPRFIYGLKLLPDIKVGYGGNDVAFTEQTTTGKVN